MTNRIQVLDKGFSEFIDSMGNDFTPAQDARISTGSEAKSEKDDINLIRFLLRHKHTTPFEGVIVKFKVKAPIMVFREWHRHRTMSFNEESGRYKKLDPEYYLPELSRIKKQSTTNKQGSGEEFSERESKNFIETWEEEQASFELEYSSLIENYNMANELARLNMPVSHYSTMIVTANLLNWFRFLQLRMAPGAQFEIRQYANAIAEMIKGRFPICYQAFEDYWLNAVSFSAVEMEYIKEIVSDWMDSHDCGLVRDDNGDTVKNLSFENLKGRELQEFKTKVKIQ